MKNVPPTTASRPQGVQNSPPPVHPRRPPSRAASSDMLINTNLSSSPQKQSNLPPINSSSTNTSNKPYNEDEARTELGQAKTVGSKYQLGAMLGRGYYGKVFSAINTETTDFVAIKQIGTDKINKKQLNELMSEVNILGKLRHPNIVKYLEFVKENGTLNLILEYVEGGSLRNLVQQFGQFPESLIACYTRQVLSGIHYLHTENVLHRDIKAANILITKDGTCKLADFGMATASDNVDMLSSASSSSSKRHSVKGSPYWMSPEVIEVMDGITSASDIWSLGCTVIELYTGNPPYANLGPMGALFRIVQDENLPLPTGISNEMKDFLTACLQKDPTKRSTALQLFDHPWIVLHHTKIQKSDSNNNISSTPSPSASPSSSSSSLLTSNTIAAAAAAVGIPSSSSSSPSTSAPTSHPPSFNPRERRMTLHDATKDILRHNSVLNVRTLIQDEAAYSEGVSIQVSPSPVPSSATASAISSAAGVASSNFTPTPNLTDSSNALIESMKASLSELANCNNPNLVRSKSTDLLQQLTEIQKKMKEQEAAVRGMMAQFQRYTHNVEQLSNENFDLNQKLQEAKNGSQGDVTHWISKLRKLEESFESESGLVTAIYRGTSVRDITSSSVMDGYLYWAGEAHRGKSLKWRKVWTLLRDNFLVVYKTNSPKEQPIKICYLHSAMNAKAEKIVMDDEKKKMYNYNELMSGKELKKSSSPITCFRVSVPVDIFSNHDAGSGNTTSHSSSSSRRTSARNAVTLPETEMIFASDVPEITDSWIEAIKQHKNWYDKQL